MSASVDQLTPSIDRERPRLVGSRAAVSPMRLLRRTHLFAGLVLLPWVLMYGFTALLFNHPQLWRAPTDSGKRTFGVVPEAHPAPAQWAARAAATLAVPVRLVHPEKARVRGTVDFQGAIGDTTYDLSYDVLTGRVTGKAGTAPGVGTRDFLTSLHKARGYPDDGGVSRWSWAFVVDAMAALMLFWAVSGILMWWQARSLRLVGGIVLAASAGAAALLALGMHAAMARP